jgi:hypothetical protein
MAWSYVDYLFHYLRNSKQRALPEADSLVVTYKSGPVEVELPINLQVYNSCTSTAEGSNGDILKRVGLFKNEKYVELLFEAPAEYSLFFDFKGLADTANLEVRVKNCLVGRLSDAYFNDTGANVTPCKGRENSIKPGQAYRPENLLLPRDVQIDYEKIAEGSKVYPSAISYWGSFMTDRWDSANRILYIKGNWNGFYHLNNQYKVTLKHEVDDQAAGREHVDEIYDDAICYDIGAWDYELPESLIAPKPDQEPEFEETFTAAHALIYRFLFDDDNSDTVQYLTGVPQFYLGKGNVPLQAETLKKLLMFGPMLEQLVFKDDLHAVVNESVLDSYQNWGFEDIVVNKDIPMVIATVRLHKTAGVYAASLLDPVSVYQAAGSAGRLVFEILNQIRVFSSDYASVLYVDGPMIGNNPPFTLYSTNPVTSKADVANLEVSPGRFVQSEAPSCALLAEATILGAVCVRSSENSPVVISFTSTLLALYDALKNLTWDGYPLLTISKYLEKELGSEAIFNSVRFVIKARASDRVSGRFTKAEGFESLEYGKFYYVRDADATGGHSYVITPVKSCDDNNRKIHRVYDSYVSSVSRDGLTAPASAIDDYSRHNKVVIFSVKPVVTQTALSGEKFSTVGSLEMSSMTKLKEALNV